MNKTENKTELEIIEEIKSKLLNMDFETLLETIREINGYDYSLENYELYDNDSEFFNDIFIGDGDVMSAVRATQYGNYRYYDDYVIVNGYGNLDSYNTYDAKSLIYGDIEYISEVITNDYLENKHYNLSLYDEL